MNLVIITNHVAADRIFLCRREDLDRVSRERSRSYLCTWDECPVASHPGHHHFELERAEWEPA